MGILLILLAVLFLISLASHTDLDDQKLLGEVNPFKIDFQNQAGTAGAYSSYLLFFFFGWLSYFVPLGLLILALHFFPGEWKFKITPALWFILATGIMINLILNVLLIKDALGGIDYAGTHGGYVFYYATRLLMKITGVAGSVALLGAGLVAALVILGYAYATLTSNIRVPLFLSPGAILRALGRGISGLMRGLAEPFHERKERKQLEKAERLKQRELEKAQRASARIIKQQDTEEPEPIDEMVADNIKEQRGKVVIKKTAPKIGRVTDDYKFPGLELLADNPEAGITVNADELSMTARALKDTLETFGVTIDGQIDKYPGPVITRFEFKPAAGIKVNQITNLSDDLALALKAKRIRIIAPIPGKAAVGVEIPNLKAQMVYIKEIIGSDVYSDNRLRLPLAFGKTTGGKAICGGFGQDAASSDRRGDRLREIGLHKCINNIAFISATPQSD